MVYLGLPTDFEYLLDTYPEKQKTYESNELSPGYQKEENSPAISGESLNQLYTAIRGLSEIDRAVILLYLEEKPYQEIAQIMGTKPNNIGVRVKERLKKKFDEIEHDVAVTHWYDY